MLFLLSDICGRINTKYNVLRMALNNCLSHRASVKTYHDRYKIFLRYVEKSHPELVNVYSKNKRVPIFSVKSRRHLPTEYRRKALLPPDTVIILGERTFFQYAAIKCVISRIFDYEKCLALYLSNLDNSVLKMVNGMNDFRNLFTFFLQIVCSKDKNVFISADDEREHLKDILRKKYSEAFAIRERGESEAARWL